MFRELDAAVGDQIEMREIGWQIADVGGGVHTESEMRECVEHGKVVFVQ